MLQKEDLDYMERRIFSIHSKISGETKEDIEEMYVSIAQGLQTFGATIFTAKVVRYIICCQPDTYVAIVWGWHVNGNR